MKDLYNDNNPTATKAIVAATIVSLLMNTQSYATTPEPEQPEDDEPTPSEDNSPFGGVFTDLSDALTKSLNDDIEDESKLPSQSAPQTSIEDIDVPSMSNFTQDYDTSDAGSRLFADVRTALNIRTGPSISADKVGQLRPTDEATIVSYADGWYEIVSGEVHGFVSADYAIVGDAANEFLDELSMPSVTCAVNRLNIRSEASTESEVLDKLNRNERVVIDPEAEAAEGWVGIIAGDQRGYVSEEYIEYNEEDSIGVAASIEEIESAKLQEVLERRANSTVQNDPVYSTADEETLLAALLICEAGGSYDGMLAVGGVVMNRLRAGYAGDIRSVIYQRGQFTPAGSGKVDRTIASGVSEAARAAAREALSGVDITGGCLNFRAAFTGHSGTNIGGNVFF